jgi:hypothetical protein
MEWRALVASAFRPKGKKKSAKGARRAEGGSAYREPRDRGKARPGAAGRAAFIAGPSAIANGAEARKVAHTTRAKVRARVEHVFGDL